MSKILFILIVSFLPKNMYCQAIVEADSGAIEKYKEALKKYIGKESVDFVIKGSNGKSVSKKDLVGKVTFMNFWFESCPPCVAEFDALNRVYNEFKGQTKFQFVSFTFENKEAVERVTKKYALEFPIYYTSYEKCSLLNFNQGYPTNIIFNEKGQIIYFNAGGPTTNSEANKIINETVITKLKECF
ncbi:MAG: TlpA family protein disulfide reductase [Sphingobacteriales bacterium]|nr:TlpA family protein disulfide reductase [Sphingobacteriales bacterium]